MNVIKLIFCHKLYKVIELHIQGTGLQKKKKKAWWEWTDMECGFWRQGKVS